MKTTVYNETMELSFVVEGVEVYGYGLNQNNLRDREKVNVELILTKEDGGVYLAVDGREDWCRVWELRNLFSDLIQKTILELRLEDEFCWYELTFYVSPSANQQCAREFLHLINAKSVMGEFRKGEWFSIQLG